MRLILGDRFILMCRSWYSGLDLIKFQGQSKLFSHIFFCVFSGIIRPLRPKKKFFFGRRRLKKRSEKTRIARSKRKHRKGKGRGRAAEKKRSPLHLVWKRGRARSAKVHACGAQINQEFQEISRECEGCLKIKEKTRDFCKNLLIVSKFC